MASSDEGAKKLLARPRAQREYEVERVFSAEGGVRDKRTRYIKQVSKGG